jgi:predicted nucleotidyltransferase
MASIAIDIDRRQVAEFCKRHHIRRLALFGSVLRPDFRADSDVDVLVEFAPGLTPGFAFFSIQDELSGLMGRAVELHTAGFLSPYFRDRVRAEAQVLYAA